MQTSNATLHNRIMAIAENFSTDVRNSNFRCTIKELRTDNQSARSQNRASGAKPPRAMIRTQCHRLVLQSAQDDTAQHNIKQKPQRSVLIVGAFALRTTNEESANSPDPLIRQRRLCQVNVSLGVPVAENYILSQTIDTTSNLTRLADYPGGFDNISYINPFPLVGAGEYPIAIADFNNDGNPDLLTGGSFYIKVAGTRRYKGLVTLSLGDGDGKFSNPQSYVVDSTNQYVDDFNKDGNPDVLIVGGFYSYSHKAVLLPGDGNGGFSNAIESEIALPENSNFYLSRPLVVADYDQDGNTDIILNRLSREPSPLLVAFGDGTGKFRLIESKPETIDYSIPTNRSLSLDGDINKDGKPDRVTAYSTGDDDSRRQYLSVLLNADDEALPTEIDNGGETPNQLVLALAKIGIVLTQPKTTPTPPATQLQPQTQPSIDPLTGTKLDDKIVGTQVDTNPRVTSQRDEFRIGSGKPFVWQRERIGDFVRGQDSLVLNKATFGLPEDFSFARAKSPGEAKLSAADLVYVRGAGKLFYNENQEEKGFGRGGIIADLSDGLNLRKSDILLNLG